MSGKTRSLFLSLTIIAVILFSAFGPATIAYADGGTTPDPPPTETASGSEEGSGEDTSPPDVVTEEVTSPPQETSAEETGTSDVATETPVEATEVPAEETSTPEAATAEATDKATEATSETSSESTEAAEVTATPEPVATEAAATEEAAAPEPTGEAAPATEEAAPTEVTTVLDAVPENTTVTIVDANGQAQPLATQAAAEAVVTSDPIWCAEGTLDPRPGATGCTGSFSSFTELLGFLADPANQISGAGTIYVEQGTYQGGESTIELNPTSLPNISNANLSVTGGWDPATGLTSPANPSTFNNTSIIIGSSTTPWGGSLTLLNISMSFSNNAAGQGLTLYSQNDINLSNVDVTNAPEAGANLNAGRDVNIANSQFSRNQTTGAVINAGRNVNIRNSDFSNPANARRQDTGLDIVATGDVTLIDVLANQNRQAGANIQAGGLVTITGTPLNPDGTCPVGATCGSFFSGTKDIQGSNFFGYGLQVVTSSNIALSRVTASDNFLWGASLNNCNAATPGGSCTSSGNVAIADSIFNANTTASPGFIDDTGLLVASGGTVALNNVRANDNRLLGATIDAVGDVAINNSIFTGNNGITLDSAGNQIFHGVGLQVVTLANIALNLVNASNNTLFGANLDAGGDVAISNSIFNNQTSGSATDQTFGAAIQAGGNVFLTTVTANNNGTDGVIVQGPCTIVNGGTFSGNGRYGLNLEGSAVNLVAPPTAGDIFPATPAVCSVLLLGGNPTTTGSVTAAGVFASLQTASQLNGSIPVTGVSAAGSATTLKSVVSKTASGGFGIFAGKYGYVYSEAGLQIVAWVSSPSEAAVRGTFRAY